MFSYLNKNEKNVFLPTLFDLLYENMKTIAPFTQTHDAEKSQWLAEVSSALDKEPRQIILCSINDEVVGFIMYYVQKNMLMIEEFQLKKTHQRTLLFHCFCKHVLSVMPDDLRSVEAYADKRNIASIQNQDFFICAVQQNRYVII